MTTWHFPTSCRAILTGRKSATLPTPSYHTGIEAALPQLRVLPPQSTIKMFTDTFWGTTLRMMSTAQPSLPHITLLPWCMKGTEAATMSALCSVQQPVLHARVRVLSVATDEYATRAWPWKTFHIGGLTSGGLQSLLRLPDPGQAEGGMCEVGIGFLHLTPMTYEKVWLGNAKSQSTATWCHSSTYMAGLQVLCMLTLHACICMQYMLMLCTFMCCMHGRICLFTTYLLCVCPCVCVWCVVCTHSGHLNKLPSSTTAYNT